MNKLLANKFTIKFFSLLSKQTYSIYLFHFIILYLISLNDFLLNSSLTFVFYLASLFLFSSIFYLLFEKNIIENRPQYK